MSQSNIAYKRNFALIPVFMVVLTITFLIALFFGYNFTKKVVESQFATNKVEVLEETLKPYNHLVFNQIPKISIHHGFLNESSILKLSANFFKTDSFIKSITFYDINVGNMPIEDGFKQEKLAIGVNAVYRIDHANPTFAKCLFSKNKFGEFSGKDANNFTKCVLKYAEFISNYDSSIPIATDQIFKSFYTFNDKQISFINVPSAADIKIYQTISKLDVPVAVSFEQDMLSFDLDPERLPIINNSPNLYEHIYVKPVTYDSLINDKHYLTTSIALSGAFSGYQLYFISSKSFFRNRVSMMFAPIAIGISAFYIIMLVIAILIYRNLSIYSKLFKLQYDFLNNLTHEFKTPVSVIKIAANNMKSKSELTIKEKDLYVRILDEEADKLNDLMNKLLSLTQLENRSLKVNIQEIDLGQLFMEFKESYQLKYPDFQISYELNKINTIYSDKVLLISLFQNLFDNAYKYSQAHQRYLNIIVESRKQQIAFRFIDKGIGIEKSELRNVFKKFYRIENQFNQNGSVGIGLAFCKEVANFLAGDIEVKSEPGMGSEFIVSLPFNYNELVTKS